MTTSNGSTLRPAVHDRDHTQGAAHAAVILVEYGDFQCPYCARAHPIVEAVRAGLGDRLRFVFRNFPITTLHPHALHAAEAAESVAVRAGEDAYWVMHASLFGHQRDSRQSLDDAHLVAYAGIAGADPDQVREDLRTSAYEERVMGDFKGGIRSGVNGTPTFFINGARFDGDWTDPDSFAAALEAAATEAAGVGTA